MSNLEKVMPKLKPGLPALALRALSTLAFLSPKLNFMRCFFSTVVTTVVSPFLTVVVVVVVVVSCAKPMLATAAIIAVSNKRFIYFGVIISTMCLLFFYFENAQVNGGNARSIVVVAICKLYQFI